MILCECGLSWKDGDERWAYHHWRMVVSHDKRGHKMRGHALTIALPTTLRVLEAVRKYDLDGMPPILAYALRHAGTPGD